MEWGYALGWPKEYLSLDEEPQLARLKFVKKWGLKSTSPGIDALAALDDRKRETLFAYANENGLRINPVFHANLFVMEGDEPRLGDRDDIARRRDASLDFFSRHVKAMRSHIVSMSAGPVHRFMKSPSLEQQLAFMRDELNPFSRAIAAYDVPLGIENHGDYYVSDIVGLVKQMDNAGVFLDTGNTYLVGEQPILAFQAGAPYTVGTHFKDQRVRPRPDGRPLNFEVGNAIPGQGDVPLREAYRLLRDQAPRPDRLAMEIEMFPPADMNPDDAIRQAVEFIQELEAMK